MPQTHGSAAEPPYGESLPPSGPPRGRYDADRVVRIARERAPGLDWESTCALAAAAGRHLADLGAPDAPEVARRLLADLPEAGASSAAVVAAAAAEVWGASGNA